MKILALDLGKSKTVACNLDSVDNSERFTTVASTPTALTALFEGEQPDRVVFEIGPQAGWVHDLVAAHGLDAQVANPNHEAWRWRQVKRKTELAVIEHVSELDELPDFYDPVQTENGRLAIASLVEDELILGLPQIPRKPGLKKVEYSTGGKPVEEGKPRARKNPFSALQDMLKPDKQN